MMDNRRLFPLIAFLLASYMLWDAWIKEYQPIVAANPTTVSQSIDVAVPQTSLGGSAAATATAGLPSSEAIGNNSPTMTVTTDGVIATISAQGGDIVKLELRKHLAKGSEKKDFVLFDNGGDHFYAAQTGLLGEGMPNHKSLFKLPAAAMQLAAGSDQLELRLIAENPPAGLQVSKTLLFKRNSYLVDVRYEVTNNSAASIVPFAYYQFTRDGRAAEETSGLFSGVHTFTGPAVYTTQAKYQKIKFEDIAKAKTEFEKKSDNGWLAMVQHYFVGAWLPVGNEQREFFASKINADLYSSGVIVGLGEVAPGATKTADMHLYAGPQEQKTLAIIAPGLPLVVDYGWLTFIAQPLFTVLSWLHSILGNWGWAIIAVTALIKLIFFPLSAASYKSMAKMRKLAPVMQRLKEKHGDDRMGMQQEMMAFYKKEKINPLGGCLPILVQIPVFLALYWVLLGSVEMRHAPWIGWITDLSVKDPYFVLPLIMGVTMYIQMKLNPAPPDPIQAKVMMMMPFVFTVMMAWFPAGLVLYWTVNNTLSIAQQWQITRMIEGGGVKKPT